MLFWPLQQDTFCRKFVHRTVDLGKDVGDTGEVYLGEVKDQNKLLEELNDLVGQLEDLVEEERYLEGILIL